MSLHLRNIPTRAATGAFILHSGLSKWKGRRSRPKVCTGWPSGAFPFLASMPPAKFLKALAGAEIGIGAALLVPVVGNKLAGAALTAFSGGLLAMYLRTPALHEPGSVWPTPGRHRGQQGRLDARDRAGATG